MYTYDIDPIEIRVLLSLATVLEYLYVDLTVLITYSKLVSRSKYILDILRKTLARS